MGTFEESGDDGEAGCEVAVGHNDEALLPSLLVRHQVLEVGSSDLEGPPFVTP